MFTSAPLSLRPRNQYFGLSGKWSRVKLRALNRQLVILSRVVIHPTFRGAGLASAFIHQSCRSCPYPWIEALAQMGHINPFFEKAGFVRAGVSRNGASRSGAHQNGVHQNGARRKKKSRSIAQHSAIYGNKPRNHGQKKLLSKETHEKSRYAEPVYYIFDNRDQTDNRKSDNSETTR